MTAVGMGTVLEEGKGADGPASVPARREEVPPRHQRDADRRTTAVAVPREADDQPDFAEEYDHASGRLDDEASPERGVW